MSDRDPLLTQGFEFCIPQEQIAYAPRPRREHRLLVYDRSTGRSAHYAFAEFCAALPPHTLIVINNSKVVRAALRKVPDDGSYVQVLNPNELRLESVVTRLSLPVGAGITVTGGRYTVTDSPLPGKDIRVGRIDPADSTLATLPEFLARHGSLPIPTYISSERLPESLDERAYQVCYAHVPGSIACPTAGLHFYPELMDDLRAAGHEVVEVTLHIGYGSWGDVETDYLDEFDLDAEEIHVEAEALRRLREARQTGRRLLAVGTTCVRTLESVAQEVTHGTWPPEGVHRTTNLFIYPSHQFQVADMLLTDFAYPRTPVMIMSAAFCGLDPLLSVYREALDAGYMFDIFGDALLIV